MRTERVLRSVPSVKDKRRAAYDACYRAWWSCHWLTTEVKEPERGQYELEDLLDRLEAVLDLLSTEQ